MATAERYAEFKEIGALYPGPRLQPPFQSFFGPKKHKIDVTTISTPFWPKMDEMAKKKF
jgi:hypothetical protein